jgi:thymidylate synthase
MENYINLASHILKHGHKRMDRTGTGTLAIFGPQLEFDLRDGFPVVTTKRVNMHLVWTELLWMISGSGSLRPLIEAGNNIWNEWPFKKWIEATGQNVDIRQPDSMGYKLSMAWFKGSILNDPEFASKWGDLGPVYGVQWRKWQGWSEANAADGIHIRTWIDQLQNAIDTIKSNPTDRRILVTAWNPGELDEMALPPCHMFYQLFVEDDYLDIKVYQRSADVFLGLPFDIASYATLQSMIGYITGKIPRNLIYTLGDTHIYTNHVDVMTTQVSREPYPLPHINVNTHGREINNINDFTIDDLSLIDYKHHKVLRGPVSV